MSKVKSDHALSPALALERVGADALFSEGHEIKLLHNWAFVADYEDNAGERIIGAFWSDAAPAWMMVALLEQAQTMLYPDEDEEDA